MKCIFSGHEFGVENECEFILHTNAKNNNTKQIKIRENENSEKNCTWLECDVGWYATMYVWTLCCRYCIHHFCNKTLKRAPSKLNIAIKNAEDVSIFFIDGNQIARCDLILKTNKQTIK